MERGSYVAASGGLIQLRRLDVVNNNLANVNTPGFKSQFLVNRTRSFDETLASKMGVKDPFAKKDDERSPAAVHINTATDFSAGPIKETGSPFDVALRNPKEFFSIQTPDGERYTRAGNFTLSVDGELVTQDGFPVVGDGGPIAVNGPNARISAAGIMTVGREQVGKLKIVRFEDPSNLQRVDGTRFNLAPGVAAPEQVDVVSVVPGALEMSNVSAISSIVELISANKGFDMYTKSVHAIDEMNTAAISRIGRRG